MNLMQLFGIKSQKQKITEAKARGALVVDVRTPAEFKHGHIRGSVNIPLDKIASKSAELAKKGKPVITCCRSGMRSRSAAMTLKAKNIEAINGGAWTSLQKLL